MNMQTNDIHPRLVELSLERIALEEAGETDPVKWQTLADKFKAIAAVLNYEKCAGRAAYYRMGAL